MFEKQGTIRISKMVSIINNLVPTDKIICDLGCGKGAISNSVKAKKIITIDIDPANEPDIVHNFVDGIPLDDESVDICIAGEILEHVYHSKLFLKDIRRVLKPNGKLILSTPNICSLKYRFAFMFGILPSNAARADMFYEDGMPGHVRDYTFYEVKNLMAKCGLKVILETSDGLYYHGIKVIPESVLPITMQECIIVMAEK